MPRGRTASPAKTRRARASASGCSDRFEREALGQGLSPVAGADEVGRGALFGPVVAAVVILGPGFDWQGLDDSKKLAESRREELSARIVESAHAWAVGEATAGEIDRLNIRQATHLALRRAHQALETRPGLILVDGVDEPFLDVRQRAIVKGDALSVSIAAASIIAKVRRDSMMAAFDADFPGYGLSENKGYGSEDHRDALRRLGPTPLHRRSFIELSGWLF